MYVLEHTLAHTHNRYYIIIYLYFMFRMYTVYIGKSGAGHILLQNHERRTRFK